jgi:uncharacterized alkaline shock family protein YloU
MMGKHQDVTGVAEIQRASAALMEAATRLGRDVVVEEDERTVNVYVIVNHGWIYPRDRRA